MGRAVTALRPAIAAFYEAPNEVAVTALQGEAGELVNVLLGRLEAGDRTLLPARVDGATRWYGLAQSDRDGRLLLEEMGSWLGPPVTEGTRIVESPQDEVDERAGHLVPGGLLLRAVVGPDWQGDARANIRSLVDLWTLTPERSPDAPRPVGRVLRQFYEAIPAGDRGSATDALEEIRSGGLLSATNVRFLRVELLGSLGSAAELRDDPLLADITQLRRPPAVTDHLARAADALYIPEGASDSSVDVWRAIATDIEDAWPGLIAHPSQVRSIHGARCLALAELLATEPRRGVREHLRAQWAGDSLLSRLVETLDASGAPVAVDDEPRTSIELALAHYHRGDFELALGTAEGADDVDRGLSAAVMHAALNLGDASSAARALAIVDRLPEADRDQLLSQAVECAFHAQLVDKNQGLSIPTGWIDWLRGEWPDRPDLVHEWSADWGTANSLTSREADDLAGELLDALHDERRGRVRNGLPALVGWLRGEDGLTPSLVPLAVTIFDIMLGSEPGRSERMAALDLLGEVLLVGCSENEYESAINAIREQLGLLGPREVDWLTQVLDVCLWSAVPDRRLRDELFGEALGVAVSWLERMDPPEALVLSKLFSDAGLAFDPPARAGDEPRPERDKKIFARVGIYSLSESAAQNAARWITDEWPGVDVRLSHAHSNSSELQSLVRGSDVVLMQTSHAKHAATTAIEGAIAEAKLVRVNGRGASSLFRGLLEWADADG